MCRIRQFYRLFAFTEVVMRLVGGEMRGHSAMAWVKNQVTVPAGWLLRKGLRESGKFMVVAGRLLLKGARHAISIWGARNFDL